MTVVSYPQQAYAAATGLDIHLPSPCIDGVFEQLLENGGRSFDDLPGSNLVDKISVELTDDSL